MKSRTLIGILVLVVVVVIAIGAWFLFGTATGQALLGMHADMATSTPATGMATSTRTRGAYGMGNGNTARGSIEVLNDDGFTLTLADGTTKDILTTATTTVYDFASASSTPTAITSDQLSVGEQVQVYGSPDVAANGLDAKLVLAGTLPARTELLSVLKSAGIVVPRRMGSSTRPVMRQQ